MNPCQRSGSTLRSGGPVVGKHRAIHRSARLRLAVLSILSAALLALPLATSHQAAHASSQAPRLSAFFWARAHAGDSYCWGGSGPSCFDCSGLVMAAYSHEGLYFGRTTYEMLASGKLIPEAESQARRGDLAFYGTGHVEFFVRPGHTFGALQTGTLIGWHPWNAFWHPTMFFRVRGAG
jgi:cell wall-associated NlpC family hydrolase